MKWKNHNLWIFYCFFSFFLFSCKENSTTPVKKHDCALPFQWLDPNSNPIPQQNIYQLSPDGNNLLISNQDLYFEILNLKTLDKKQIDIQSLLPSNMKIYGIINGFWCPYNSNRFILNCLTSTDTVGDGKKFVPGRHLIISSIDGKEFEIVTPKILGPEGGRYGLGLFGWLPNSSVNNDNILIGYHIFINDNSLFVIFTPQTQAESKETPADYRTVGSFTWDGKYYCWAFLKNDSSGENIITMINNTEIIFNYMNYHIGNGRFSPNGKKIAFWIDIRDSGKTDDKQRLSEIWIANIDDIMVKHISPVPVKIINIKEKLCMFSISLMATFTSENTLAISVIHAGDNYAYLYEIDTDGKMLRQLTFSP